MSLLYESHKSPFIKMVKDNLFIVYGFKIVITNTKIISEIKLIKNKKTTKVYLNNSIGITQLENSIKTLFLENGINRVYSCYFANELICSITDDTHDIIEHNIGEIITFREIIGQNINCDVSIKNVFIKGNTLYYSLNLDKVYRI